MSRNSFNVRIWHGTPPLTGYVAVFFSCQRIYVKEDYLKFTFVTSSVRKITFSKGSSTISDELWYRSFLYISNKTPVYMYYIINNSMLSVSSVRWNIIHEQSSFVENTLKTNLFLYAKSRNSNTVFHPWFSKVKHCFVEKARQLLKKRKHSIWKHKS